MAIVVQAFRYGIVGLISTAINYVLFIAFIATGLHYLAAATICSVVTVVAGYFMHRTFTFAVPGPANIGEFVSFLGVFGVQYFVAMSGYTILIGYLGLGPTLAFILNNAVVTSVAFGIMRYRTFRTARSYTSRPNL